MAAQNRKKAAGSNNLRHVLKNEHAKQIKLMMDAFQPDPVMTSTALNIIRLIRMAFANVLK